MSDYNSSLPVRTQNDGDVVAKIADATTPSQQLKVEADGSINVNDNGGSLTVDATDLDIRDLAAATDSVSAWLKDEAGNAFSESNPLPVYPTEDPGTERLEFDQASNIAANATSTHSAAAAVGGTKWYGMTGSASGKCKWDIYYGPTGSEVLKVVLFNSTATPNVEFKMDKPILLATGNSVKIVKTNRDNQAQDLYDTIVMIDV